MSDTTLPLADRVTKKRRTGWFRDPWRTPRILQTITVGYLAWSLLPVIIAVLFSFNSGRSRSTWQGFSLRWWTQEPFEALFQNQDLLNAMVQTFRLAFFTVLIAVPLGTAFAIGIDRWRGRLPRTANFGMLLSFVMPEIILGTALFLLFTGLLKNVPLFDLGTIPQIIGLATFQISYPVIVVRARLLGIGSEYEEAAMDLGATPSHAIRRVLLPLLTPAILASTVLVFADSVDNFVTVRYLSGPAASEPLSVKIYAAARSSPTPAVNAAATVMLLSTLVMIGLGLTFYKRFNRGQTSGNAVDFAQL